MNWIYELIAPHFFWGGRYTNELEDIRMNWGSFFFGRHTNELEYIRMNWGSDFFWGRHTNELRVQQRACGGYRGSKV